MLGISEKDSCNDQGRLCEGKFRCSWYPRYGTGFDGMLQRKSRRIENRRERSVRKSTGRFRQNCERCCEVVYSKCAIMGSRWGWSGPMGTAGWAKLPVDAAPAGSTQFLVPRERDWETIEKDYVVDRGEAAKSENRWDGYSGDSIQDPGSERGYSARGWAARVAAGTCDSSSGKPDRIREHDSAKAHSPGYCHPQSMVSLFFFFFFFHYMR